MLHYHDSTGKQDEGVAIFLIDLILLGILEPKILVENYIKKNTILEIFHN